MERYRVYSRPEQSDWAVYRDWLTAHAAEVVLLGGFAGGEVAESPDTMVSDYLAPSQAALDTYVQTHAPALRAEAERLYPHVARSRDQLKVTARVSAAFDWDSLGLIGPTGQPVPTPADGLFELIYVAPWCEDCHKEVATLAARVRTMGDRALLVGVYASLAEAAPWLSEVSGGARWAVEPSTRDDSSRRRTFHAFLRQLSADARQWGLPVRYRLRVGAGRFVVSWP